MLKLIAGAFALLLISATANAQTPLDCSSSTVVCGPMIEVGPKIGPAGTDNPPCTMLPSIIRQWVTDGLRNAAAGAAAFNGTNLTFLNKSVGDYVQARSGELGWARGEYSTCAAVLVVYPTVAGDGRRRLDVMFGQYEPGAPATRPTANSLGLTGLPGGCPYCNVLAFETPVFANFVDAGGTTRSVAVVYSVTKNWSDGFSRLFQLRALFASPVR